MGGAFFAIRFLMRIAKVTIAGDHGCFFVFSNPQVTLRFELIGLTKMGLYMNSFINLLKITI